MRVILKHLTGSRSPEVDVFPLGAQSELMLGPSGAVTIRFLPLLDERAGQWFARIVPVEGTPGRFVLVDLNGASGLWVNGRRVTDAQLLRPGDVLQVGEEGPRIEFQVERTA